jgi:hypothetical protein
MIKSINEKPKLNPIEIDLTGPDGNVFVLIGIGNRYCKQMGLDSQIFTNRMMGGDYETAINVFEEYFGRFVTLYR